MLVEDISNITSNVSISNHLNTSIGISSFSNQNGTSQTTNVANVDFMRYFKNINSFDCSDSLYGQLIDVTDTNKRINLTVIPCLIGGKLDMNGQDQENNLEANREIIVNSVLLLKSLNCEIDKRLEINDCNCMSYIHAIIFYNYDDNYLYFKALENCFINNKLVTFESEPVKINCYERITFPCFNTSHNYILIIPNLSDSKIPENFGKDINNNKQDNIDDENAFIGAIGSSEEEPDHLLSNSWTIHEKDCLRKYIMIYGYGKWIQIQKSSGGVLNDKPIAELRIFTNCFLKTICELLPLEKSELKRFLEELIERKKNEPFVVSKKDDWGSMFKDRTSAWGKRIQLICRVNFLIEKFKIERNKNKEIRIKCQLIGDSTDLIKINKLYDNWENLLNFIPNEALFGQRPAVWWSRIHDVDLLRGTYKYGYANYQLMRIDPKLSFCKAENESNFQDFPIADNITRRLKKLIQIIVKIESNNGGAISFEKASSNKESTGFTLNEKIKIYEYLKDKGVPVNSTGRNDWIALKEELLKMEVIEGKHSLQEYEKLVQKFRVICNVVIKLDSNSNDGENDNSIDAKKYDELDPDNDGFEISLEDSKIYLRNIDLLTFIRKNVLVDLKLFDKVEESMKNVKNLDLPKEWKSMEHDRILFELISEKGFSYLESIHEDNSFLEFELEQEDYMNRIIFLCDFFKTITQTQKTKKKNQIREIQNELLNTKLKTEVSQDNFLNQDSIDGSGKKKYKKSLDLDLLNISYPLQISPTLRLVNLGKIEYKRPGFHNENNIFPIGYKAVREHYSYLNPHIKALYTCEILDGGEKPLFKVTFENEEDNSIVKDTCTACWIIICNKINDIIQNRKGKVTISGTERFGLADATVVKLIQSQPEFKLLTKYKTK